jgi:hypothetical protein
VVLADEKQVIGQVSTSSKPSRAGEVRNDGAAGVTVALDHVEQRGARHVLLVPAADRRSDTREQVRRPVSCTAVIARTAIGRGCHLAPPDF